VKTGWISKTSLITLGRLDNACLTFAKVRRSVAGFGRALRVLLVLGFASPPEVSGGLRRVRHHCCSLPTGVMMFLSHYLPGLPAAIQYRLTDTSCKPERRVAHHYPDGQCLVDQTVNAISNQHQQGSACGYGDKEEKDAKHSQPESDAPLGRAVGHLERSCRSGSG
jgi:hypothetical protein